MMKVHSKVGVGGLKHWKAEDYCWYWSSVVNIRGREAEEEYCVQVERGAQDSPINKVISSYSLSQQL